MFSRNEIITKRRMICGTKPRTEPTPPISPSETNPASNSLGMRDVASAPSHSKKVLIPSVNGAAQAKITWKKVTMTRAKIAVPTPGWSRIRSTRSVHGLRSPATWTAWAVTESIHPARPSGSLGGSRTGRGQPAGFSSRPRTDSTPRPEVPTAPITSMPRALDSAGMLMLPPPASTSSIIVSTRAVGRPSRNACPTSTSERSKVVASTTSSSASGGGASGFLPSRRSLTTCSSGLTGSRL